MDVTNLIPMPGPSDPRGAHPAPRRQAVEAAVAPASAHTPRPAAVSPRPAPATTPTSDRAARSEELSRQVAELELELGREPELAKERIDELRREIRDAKLVSHDALLKAALGILHGELYFLAS